MQTLKTALVVVLLLAGLYVAYQALNKQPIGLPFELAGEPWKSPDGAEPSPDLSVEAPPMASMELPQALTNPTTSQSGLPGFPVGTTTSPPPAPGVSAPTSEFPTPADPSAAASFIQQTTSLQPAATAEAAAVATAGIAPPSSSPPAEAVAGSSSMSSETAPAGSETAPSAPTAQPSPEAPGAEAPGRTSSAAVVKYSFEQAWSKAELQIGDGQLARALLTLSAFYRNPDLDEVSQRKLDERLDQLAGTVIYSTRHLLEESYKTRRGETLQDIAKRYKVSAKLLQNINGVQDPNLLLPGLELKVLRGPFRAEVDLSRSELTVFLGGLYAGRFPLTMGRDPAPRPGQYEVLDLQPGHNYYAATGQMIPAGTPTNPYGRCWIDLGRDLCLHGSPESGPDTKAGCLSLAPRDATDVAAILTVGSKVSIK